MCIVPKPNGEWSDCDGNWKVPDVLNVDYGDFETYCTDSYGVRSGVTLQENAKGASLQLVRNKVFAPEEYELTIKDTVKITAATEKGVIWALTTLFLGTKDKSHKCGTLHDQPKYSHRGFHIDSSRHFFSVETIKSVLDVAGLAKMNPFHWHLTDDQGWRLESSKYPLLTKNGPFYSKEEIREVVSYAQKCGIDIVPEINVPGHTSAVLAAYPQFGCFGKEVPIRKGAGIFPIILCGGKDETLTFIKDILTETAELFPGELFHVGGDEAPKAEWRKCPHCAARMKEHDITDFNDLQGWLLSQITEHLKQLGKRTICWNDGFNKRNFDNNVINQQWTDNVPENLTLQYWQQGGEIIFSDVLYCYFDYSIAVTSLKKVYKYSPKSQKINCADAKNTRGIECCLWSEDVRTPEELGKQLFPRLFAIAERGWSHESNYSRFEGNLPPVLAYLDQHNISYTPLIDANPKGKARRQGIDDFLTSFVQLRAISADGVKGNMTHIYKRIFKACGLDALPTIFKLMRKK